MRIYSWIQVLAPHEQHLTPVCWRCSGRVEWAEYPHAIFLLCAVLIHFFLNTFGVSSFLFYFIIFWKLLQPHRERKNTTARPEAASAAQQFAAGFGAGYKHILCLLLELVGAACAKRGREILLGLVSAIAHPRGEIPGCGCSQHSHMNAAVPIHC